MTETALWAQIAVFCCAFAAYVIYRVIDARPAQEGVVMVEHKQKCPKDADTTFGTCKKVCFIDNGQFFCLRVKGHKGAHHAHLGDGKCLVVWGND